MPLLKLKTNTADIPVAVRAEIQKASSLILAEEIGKSEEFVMVIVETEHDIYFSGSTEPSAYAEIKNVGTLSPEVTEKISHRLSNLLKDKLSIPPNRCFLEFQESLRHLWGWNGKTFAS
jgi:phenylpyruvate tautomerase